MALIHCPECAKEVSDQARSCPDCGYPVAERMGTADNGPSGDQSKTLDDPPRESYLLPAAVAFFAIAGGAGLAWQLAVDLFVILATVVGVGIVIVLLGLLGLV